MIPSLNTLGGRHPAEAPRLRDDLKKAAAQEFEQVLGRAGSPERERMERAARASLGVAEGQPVSLDSLPPDAARKMAELQGAAEGFESLFVKGLLSQMRRSSFAEETGPYGDLAKDFMDQALAQQTAESPNGFGIAASVFRATVGRLLREAASAPTSETAPTPRNQ